MIFWRFSNSRKIIFVGDFKIFRMHFCDSRKEEKKCFSFDKNFPISMTLDELQSKVWNSIERNIIDLKSFYSNSTFQTVVFLVILLMVAHKLYKIKMYHIKFYKNLKQNDKSCLTYSKWWKTHFLTKKCSKIKVFKPSSIFLNKYNKRLSILIIFS